MISKKNAPKVSDPHLDRIIRQIYSDINAVIDAINQSARSGSPQEREGKSGDVRVVEGDDGVHVEVKSNTGWFTSAPLTKTDKRGS